MDEKHKKLSVIGFAILLIGLVGVTYAFFNYTRTGSANRLGTGRIYFNTSQGEELTITSVFPMTSTEAGNATLDTVTVGIAGDTTYTDGEEFEITLVDVTNTINNKSIPINYIATYTAATGGTIGESNNDYWEDRNDKDATIYKLNATGDVVEGKQVLVGYIDNGSTGISGTLTISAYIDADRIAISDTYYENVTATPTPTAPTDMYGTTTEWVDGRVVLTTEEWNSLTSNPISFKIKTESNEGIWTGPQIESCLGCKYLYTENTYYYGGASSDSTNVSTLTGVTNDYTKLNKNYFLGFTEANGKIDRAFACGIKGENPNQGVAFCVEGAIADSNVPPIYSLNKELLNNSTTGLWQGGCDSDESYVSCLGDIGAYVTSYGYVYVVNNSDGYICDVGSNGTMGCGE